MRLFACSEHLSDFEVSVQLVHLLGYAELHAQCVGRGVVPKGGGERLGGG